MERPDGLDPAGTAGGRLRGVGGEAVALGRGGAAKRVLPADQGPAQGSARAGRTDQGNDRGRALVRIPNGGWLVGDEQERCSGPSSSRAGRCASGRWATAHGSKLCHRWRQPPTNAGPRTCAGSGVVATAG